MEQILINRYQAVNPDTGQAGDLYLAEQTKFGTQGANSIASSALTGDETAVTAAVEQGEIVIIENTMGVRITDFNTED